VAGYVVAPYERTRIPTARQLHVLNRLGWGYTRSGYRQLLRAGGEDAWFDQQLDPDSIQESGKASAVSHWYPELAKSAADMWAEDQAGTRGQGAVANDLANLAILRRVYTRRPVFEQMVDFWSNHLHINSRHPRAFTQRPAYDAVIRKHALGRFEDMLVEASLHPAMLIYLNNWKSVRGNPNENHGRELLELHTVGLASGYTEAMIKDSAKILSGYTVRGEGASILSGYYDPGKHTTGAVRVLGFRAENRLADGSQLTVDYLRYLARHPATAERIARKLARIEQTMRVRIARGELRRIRELTQTIKALEAEIAASSPRSPRTC